MELAKGNYGNSNRMEVSISFILKIIVRVEELYKPYEIQNR
jgi:hypothetical protein